MAFYLGVLGFRPHIQSRWYSLFDCGTQKRPHMVAFNIWARDDFREPPPGAAGLSISPLCFLPGRTSRLSRTG